MRIKYPWEAIDAENEAIEKAKGTVSDFKAEILSNGDTVKQLLARSRYVLYKKPADWTNSRKKEQEYFLKDILICNMLIILPWN